MPICTPCHPEHTAAVCEDGVHGRIGVQRCCYCQHRPRPGVPTKATQGSVQTPTTTGTRVIPLHGRHDADLLTRLREALADRGAVNEDLAARNVVAATWRTTPRRARDLQRPVRTAQVEHPGNMVMVWAAWSDWSATDTERATFEALQRRTAAAVAADLHALLKQTPPTDQIDAI